VVVAVVVADMVHLPPMAVIQQAPYSVQEVETAELQPAQQTFPLLVVVAAAVAELLMCAHTLSVTLVQFRHLAVTVETRKAEPTVVVAVVAVVVVFLSSITQPLETELELSTSTAARLVLVVQLRWVLMDIQ
jgi:hypothetical protein